MSLVKRLCNWAWWPTRIAALEGEVARLKVVQVQGDSACSESNAAKSWWIEIIGTGKRGEGAT